jgi:hypothetical protein
MKIYSHVTVLDVELERRHFTKRDLHMNYRRKEKAANVIVRTTENRNILKNKEIAVLQWKDMGQLRKKKEDKPVQKQEEPMQINRPTTRSSHHVQAPGQL